MWYWMLWGYVVAESGVSLVVKGVWATLTPPLNRETDCDKITAKPNPTTQQPKYDRILRYKVITSVADTSV